jgi:hypothetical protein
MSGSRSVTEGGRAGGASGLASAGPAIEGARTSRPLARERDVPFEITIRDSLGLSTPSHSDSLTPRMGRALQSRAARKQR